MSCQNQNKAEMPQASQAENRAGDGIRAAGMRAAGGTRGGPEGRTAARQKAWKACVAA